MKELSPINLIIVGSLVLVALVGAAQVANIDFDFNSGGGHVSGTAIQLLLVSAAGVAFRLRRATTSL